MLPIDEHAKSAKLIYIRRRGGGLWMSAWFGDNEGEPVFWLYTGSENSFINAEDVEGYLPASWVEQAGEMREALEDVFRPYGLYDQAIHRTTDAPALQHALMTAGKRAKETLAATEWPKGGAA